jgi:hypothetical protein
VHSTLNLSSQVFPGHSKNAEISKKLSLAPTRNMSELYGVRTVFVTSDSESVYDELPEFANEGFR